MRSRARAAGAALFVAAIGLAGALVAPAADAAAEGEAPAVVRVGDEAPVGFNFGVSPKYLPARDPGSTELGLSLEEDLNSNGGIPFGIKEARIGLDRSIQLERGDLPICRQPGVNAPQDLEGKECPRAVVGHAESTILIAFAETSPVTIQTVGRIYNGGANRGAPELLVEMPVASPVSGTLWLIVRVQPVARGRIGSEASFDVPTIAGGSGFLTDLKLDLRRGFTERGAHTGYVSADCPDGKLTATSAVTFTDGTKYAQESVRACRTR